LSSRLYHLEAVRGLAAIVVLLHHGFLGFAPTVTGFLNSPGMRDATSFVGSPLFFLVNGQGAVVLFFVLSGFVLPMRYFEAGDARIIVVASLKRLPRLYLPVACSILLTWLLFQVGAFAFTPAAAISGSSWLANSAFADATHLRVDLREAIAATWTVFSVGNSTFNNVLWTMRPELLGSFLVFGMAPLLRASRGSLEATGLVALALVFTATCADVLVPFALGCALSYLARAVPRSLPWPAATVMIVLGLACLSYVEPIGAYSFLGNLPQSQLLVFGINAFGAGLLLLAVHHNRGLSRGLGSRLGYWLGLYSFPIYLVHFLVIATLGSAAFVYAHATGCNPFWTASAAFAVTVVGSVVLATPLAAIDTLWLRLLGRVFSGSSERKVVAQDRQAPAE